MFGEANVKAENNLIAAVSVFLAGFIIVPLAIYFIFKEKFVRFHSLQALLLVIVGMIVGFALGMIIGIVSVILGPIGLLLGILGLIYWLAYLLLWIYMVYSAFTGKATKLPVIGGFAENWA